MQFKNLWLPVTLILCFLSLTAWAAEPAHLMDIRTSTLAGYTRITLVLDKEVEYTLTHHPRRNILTITLVDTVIISSQRKLKVNSPQVKRILAKQRKNNLEIIVEKKDKGSQYHYFISSASPHLILDIGEVSVLTSPEKSSATRGEYIIAPQDLLKITVYEYPELTQTVKVSSAGMITFPLLEKVKVSGLSASQAEKELEKRLGEKYLVNPQVTVYVAQSANIYVLGQVEKPGAYKLSANLTIVEAITVAGGFTRTAVANRTKIIRSSGGIKTTINIPVNKVIKRGDKSKDILLEAGDVIIVPQSFF